MSRSVVLHAADLHLDAPFEGIGRTPAHIGTALRDASLDAWDALVELAIARQCAAVLLAGGLCEGLERGVRAQARLRDGVARMAAAGIRVCIALGGRDPLDGFAVLSNWPSGVTVFAAGAPTAVALEHDGARIATVHGVSAGAGAGDVALRFARGDAPGPHLAVLHASLADERPAGGACAPCRLADLRAAGMDYWALGHAHALCNHSIGTPWILYPGTPQGRGLAEAECGAKGVLMVTIEDETIARVDFEPLDRVRCLRVELTDAAEPSALAARLGDLAAALRDRHAGRALLLDAYVGGTPAVERAMRRPAARAELLRALRRAAERWEPFVWWAGLEGAPAVSDARDAAFVADDLPAEVERRRVALADDAAQRARFFARRFEPLRDAWTADVDAREDCALLDEAAAVAVDALREDGA
jgi:hypothetical protein